MRALVAVGALAACAGPRALALPDRIPPALAVGADQTLAFVWHGEGVQRYTCRDGAWVFVEPKATLTDAAGRPTGFHFAGPSWQATDTSSAVGRKLHEAIVDPRALPWLVLQVSSHDGHAGVLADVTQIQRVATTGGLAPPAPCPTAGAPLDVPYTADYAFYRKR